MGLGDHEVQRGGGFAARRGSAWRRPRLTGTVLLVLGVGLVLGLGPGRPGVARGQAPPGFLDVAVPTTGGATAVARVGERFEGLLPPPPPENLSAIWSLRRTLAAQGSETAELEKLRALEELRRDLGWPGLPEVSAALLHEAGRLLDAGREQARARRLIDWAVRLSPREPGARLGAGWLALRAFEPLQALSHWLSWPGLALQDPLQRRRLAAGAALLGVPTALAAALLLLFAAGLRHAGLLAHDLGHRLPTGSTPAQHLVLALLLLLALPLLPGGAWGVLLGGGVLLAPYLAWRERAVALAALAVIAAAPWLARPVDLQLGLPGSTRASLWRLQHGTPDGEDRARLEAALVARPDDPLLRFTGALVAKRSGDLYEAARQLALLPADHPFQRQAALLGGVVDLAQHRVKEGREALHDVAGRWPDSAAAQFDLFRITQVSPVDDSSGPEHLRTAQRLAERQVDERLGDDSAGLNRFLLDEPLPPGPLLAAAGVDPPLRPVALAVAAPWLWGRALPQAVAPWVAGATLPLLLGLWLVAVRRRHAHACAGCGRALCRRCHVLVGLTEHCEACTPGLLVVDGGAPVSTTVLGRLRREQQQRRSRLALGSSLVAPGFGQVLQGRTLRGGLLLLLASGLVVVALFGGAPLPEALPWVGPSRPMLLGGLVAGWALLAGIALHGVRRHLPEEER